MALPLLVDGARAQRAALAAMLLVLAAIAASASVSGEDGESDYDDSPETPGTEGNVTLAPGADRFSGTYVSGELPAAEAVLANFTVGGMPVFGAVAVPGYARTDAEAHDGEVEASGEAAKLQVRDAPAGYLELELKPRESVTFTPAAGAALEAGEGGGLRLTAGALEGVLFARCQGAALGLQGGAGHLTAAAETCEVYFRASTQADVLEGAELEHALSGGDLAAEVSVGGVTAGSPVSPVSFAPVEVNVTVSGDRLVLGVSGTLPSGRSVLVVVPRALIDANDSVRATFDGHPAAAARSAQDALNASDDGGAAEYYMTSAGNLTAIIVTVPHFSVHIFEMALASASLPPVRGIPAGEALLPIALGAVLVAGAAAATMRRTRVE